LLCFCRAQSLIETIAALTFDRPWSLRKIDSILKFSAGCLAPEPLPKRHRRSLARRSVPTLNLGVLMHLRKRNKHLALGLPSQAPPQEVAGNLCNNNKECSMKKLCLAGAVALLLIGATAYGFAQSSDSSQKMTPGHEMQKRGSGPGSPGASGYAPGHQDRDDHGTLRDRDDRTMNHDR